MPPDRGRISRAGRSRGRRALLASSRSHQSCMPLARFVGELVARAPRRAWPPRASGSRWQRTREREVVETGPRCLGRGSRSAFERRTATPRRLCVPIATGSGRSVRELDRAFVQRATEGSTLPTSAGVMTNGRRVDGVERIDRVHVRRGLEPPALGRAAPLQAASGRDGGSGTPAPCRIAGARSCSSGRGPCPRRLCDRKSSAYDQQATPGDRARRSAASGRNRGTSCW
jgi:hypothetical protein